MTKINHQNTAFSPLFCKKRKDSFCNKLNISALHFCILHFEDCKEKWIED